MRVEIPPSPNVRRHDDDDGYPPVALSGRGSRPAPAGSDPDLRTGEDQEDPKCQGRATPTCGAKQPPRLRPSSAGGTGLRVVSARVRRSKQRSARPHWGETPTFERGIVCPHPNWHSASAPPHRT